MKSYIFWSFLAVLAVSCDYDNEEELYPDAPECKVEGITYDVDVAPIMAKSCAYSGCHDGNSGAISLTNYAAVKASVDNGSFENRVLIQKNMPPGEQLSNCAIAQLSAWIADGALEN